MNYHAKMKLADGNVQHYINGDLDWYRLNVVIPMFNGQIVLLHDWLGKKKKTVVNMRNVLQLDLYRTKEQISAEIFDAESIEEFNCTESILDEIRTEIASQNSKSLIQKSLVENKNQIFVIMKFGDIELDSAYEGVMEPLIIEFGYDPIRVDKIQDAGKISDQILENIAASRLVISDLSGERPNCYYETGFAHALGKELILTIKESDKIHFDLSGYRFITWKTEAELRKQLRERLTSILENTKHNNM